EVLTDSEGDLTLAECQAITRANNGQVEADVPDAKPDLAGATQLLRQSLRSGNGGAKSRRWQIAKAALEWQESHSAGDGTGQADEELGNALSQFRLPEQSWSEWLRELQVALKMFGISKGDGIMTGNGSALSLNSRMSEQRRQEVVCE